MEERNNFSFFRSFFEVALSLKTAEMQAEFLMAICDYALNGKERELSDEVRILFMLVKPVLEKSRKRAKAGAAGGRGNKKTESENKTNKNQNKSKLKANEKQVASNPLYRNRNRSKDIGDKSKDIETNKEIPPPEEENGGGGFSEDTLEVIKFWEQRFGPVSSFRMQTIQDLVEDYGKEISLYAIREASDHGGSWDYVTAVARNETRRRENRGTNRVSNDTGEPELSDPYLQGLYEQAKRDGNVV